jgi:hypothetical protein
MTLLTRMTIFFLAASFLAAFFGCDGSNTGQSQGVSGVITTISCKNESSTDLWDAKATLDDRSFGFGFVSIGKKKSMGVGNVVNLKQITVHYAFSPLNENPNDVVVKTVVLPAEALRSVANDAGEVEAVCHGEGKWSIRVYKRSPDNDGPIIFEKAMTEKLAP